MTQTRIVKLYNIMETGEKTRLTAMLKYEHRNKEIENFNNYLIKYSTNHKKLNKELVFQKVFGDAKFDEPKLTQLRYKLFNVAENFLLMNWLSRKAKKNNYHLVQKQLMQLEYYKTKELPPNSTYTADLSKLIDSKLSDIERTLKNTKAQNVDYYFYLYKLNHHYYYGLNSNIWQQGSEYLNKLLYNLDIYYCLLKLRYHSEALIRKNSTNEDFSLPQSNDIQQFSKELFLVNNNEILLLELYQLCLQLSNKLNKTNLLKLADKTIEMEGILEERELGFIIPFILNNTSLIKRKQATNLTEVENLTEVNYKILKLAINREVFVVNGLLRPIVLINYFYLCAEVRDFDAIEIAWNKNEHRLEKNFKEATFNLCSAIKAFGNNNFEHALEFSKKETKQNLRFYLFRKILQIKSLYELKRYVEIEEERTNLLKYIRSNKQTFNNINQECVYNFTQITRDLVKIDIDKEQLLNKLFDGKTFPVVESKWLCQKINEK